MTLVQKLTVDNTEKQQYAIKTLDTHTGGDPTRIIIDGLPEVKGDTMLEKKNFLINNLDFIRTSLMHEPRGHRDMFGAILLEPTQPEADFGVVFMDTGGYLNMCGHGIIGVSTAVVETDIVKRSDGESTIVAETPSGLVNVKVQKHNGRVESVTFANVPSFLYESTVKIQLTDYGEISVDIAFGGSFYALVQAKDFGLKLEPKYADDLRKAGMLVKEKINEQINVRHPLVEGINTVDLTLFLEDSPTDGIATTNVCVFGKSNVARSACGTGLSAQMAIQFAKGNLKLKESFDTESMIHTVFRGRVLEEIQLGDKKAIIPEVTANAELTGKHEFLINSSDSLSKGFLLD